MEQICFSGVNMETTTCCGQCVRVCFKCLITVVAIQSIIETLCYFAQETTTDSACNHELPVLCYLRLPNAHETLRDIDGTWAGHGGTRAGHGRDTGGTHAGHAGHGGTWRDTGGTWRDMAGQGRDMAGHGRDMAGHGRDMAGHGRDMAGHGGTRAGHGRDMAGHGRDMAGPWRDMAGHWRDTGGTLAGQTSRTRPRTSRTRPRTPQTRPRTRPRTCRTRPGHPGGHAPNIPQKFQTVFNFIGKHTIYIYIHIYNCERYFYVYTPTSFCDRCVEYYVYTVYPKKL